MSDAEIASIQSNFIFNKVFETRMIKKINIEFVNNLSYKHFIT